MGMAHTGSMTNEIILDRTSDTSRALWTASWAVEKLAKEITDLAAKDLTRQDVEDIAYFINLLCRRALVLAEIPLPESL